MNQGERIAHYRKRAGLSQGALAQQLGKTQMEISRWENNGREPKMCEVEPLAKALKINPLLLLGYEEKETSWSAGYRAGCEQTTNDVLSALQKKLVLNED